MNDTTPEVAKIFRERLMALSGEQRVMMASGSFEAARRIIISTFPPGLPEREFKRLLYRRTYGEEAPADFPRE